MSLFLTIGGMLLLLVGAMGLISGDWLLIAAGLFGGLVLLALSRIIDLLEDISRQRSGAPFAAGQLAKLMRRSPARSVESELFDVHLNPRGGREYPLLHLGGEAYLRARVFLSYLRQDGDQYTFELPGQEPVTLSRTSGYAEGADLFEFQEQVFVKLRAIGMRAVVDGQKVKLEREPVR
ncbi:hypothetical protein HGI30_08015 [Paenibacillus albicereus]|uniref:Uncharacterized protein n=1 Tax=Paenibacillus albicereus TaxID=2726185 RepID=A0A6H2GVW6_9BACL|nr:hypothetical protein [Paenibacillus albicereus]QJC51499.1 hypothetical protein HGI30_08015 [Paenibacillus albicereus]